MNLNYRFMSKNFRQNVWEIGPSKHLDLNEINEKITSVLPTDLKYCKCAEWTKYYGKTISKG